MIEVNPLFLKDCYKVSHPKMYPDGTTLLFSNFTPRKSRMAGVNHSVFFGLQYFLKAYLGAFKTRVFEDRWGGNPIDIMQIKYENLMNDVFGNKNIYPHIYDLLRLKHLPIAIYALSEGAVVPCGVPALVIHNTHPDFAWVPGMLETLLSCTMWSACTSATIAREYRLLLDKYAHETSDNPEFVDYQLHDFSMRGMSSPESARISGSAHLLYFKGTDTIPALIHNDLFYDHPIEPASVPATEHSIMSAGGKEHEFDTYKRLITEVVPDGIMSIVSDTWNLWNVVSDILPRLKDRIMQRNGKVVIRPDSGNPADILCGITPEFGVSKSLTGKGLIECLWDIFGGTINSKGYKQLDPHIGAIYGDSITLDRCKDICERLKTKGFSSTNVVFGVGSYTYQYNTRDTLGWAMKCTYAEINGVGRAITKDPITDDGTKRSASGLLKVVRVDGAHGGTYQLLQNQTWDEFHMADNALKLVYKDGELI